MQDRKNFTYVKKASGKEKNKLVCSRIFLFHYRNQCF